MGSLGLIKSLSFPRYTMDLTRRDPRLSIFRDQMELYGIKPRMRVNGVDYDHVHASPWAASKDDEDRHRGLMRAMSVSARKVKVNKVIHYGRPY